MLRNLTQVVKFMLLVFLLATGAGIVFGNDSDHYTLHLTNNASCDICRMDRWSSDDPGWRRDLISDGILTSSGSIEIVNIVPGGYGLKVVDEDGDACVEIKVHCFRDKTVNITNNWLLGCEFHNPGR